MEDKGVGLPRKREDGVFKGGRSQRHVCVESEGRREEVRPGVIYDRDK